MSFQVFDEQFLRNDLLTIVLAGGTAIVGVTAAGDNGSRVDGISLLSDAAADRTLEWFIQQGGTDYIIGSVVVPAGSGYGGVAPVDGLTPIMPPALGCILLRGGATLRVRVTLALGVAETLTVAVWSAWF